MITEEQLDKDIKIARKLILIENLDELDLNTKRKKEFIEYYYNHLDQNLLEALDNFKHSK